MIKLLTKSLLIYFYLITILYSEVINEFDISGNQRISNETILVLGNIKKNVDYKTDDLNDILKKLYESNFFKDIKINLKGGLLKISVIENPIIENIEITGIKKQSFIETILENLSLKKRMSFTEDQLQKDLILLKNILKRNGFYFAKVTPSLNINKKLNSINLILDVDQGEKAKIKKIEFIGDKKIKDKKLLETITSEEHKFWKFISKKVYLNETLIDLDKRLLESFYKNQGYFDAKVQNSFAEFDKKGFFKLIFNVDAGKKYFFNDLKLILPEDYSKSDFKDIEKIFKELKGEVYSLDDFNLILNEIDKIASLKLYDFIDAKVEKRVVNDDRLNFNFKIKDSEKFYIERINIVGNFNTN